MKKQKNQVTKNLNEKVLTTIDPQTLEEANMGDVWEEMEDINEKHKNTIG